MQPPLGQAQAGLLRVEGMVRQQGRRLAQLGLGPVRPPQAQVQEAVLAVQAGARLLRRPARVRRQGAGGPLQRVQGPFPGARTAGAESVPFRGQAPGVREAFEQPRPLGGLRLQAQGFPQDPLRLPGARAFPFHRLQELAQGRVPVQGEGLQAHRQQRPAAVPAQQLQEGPRAMDLLGLRHLLQHQVPGAGPLDPGGTVGPEGEPGGDGRVQGLFRRVRIQAQRPAQVRQVQGLVRQGQAAHRRQGPGAQAAQAAAQQFRPQGLLALQGRPCAWRAGPAPPLVPDGALGLGRFQEPPQQARVAQAGGTQPRPLVLGQIMGAQQIVQHFQQGAVLQPVQHHDRRVRMVAHHPQGGPGFRAQGPLALRAQSPLALRAQARVPDGEQPRHPGPEGQVRDQRRRVRRRGAPGPGPGPAGDGAPGEGHGLQGRRGFRRLDPARPRGGPGAAGQEPEGGQAPGQAPGHRRAGRLQVRLQALDQFSHHPSQQVASGFPGAQVQVGDPEPFRLGHRRRPVAQPGVAEPRLPLQDQHPFHGDGRTEAQHQGFQVGEFPGAAAQGAPRRGGPLRRLRPGAFPGLGARRRGPIPPQLAKSASGPQGEGPRTRGASTCPGSIPTASGAATRAAPGPDRAAATQARRSRRPAASVRAQTLGRGTPHNSWRSHALSWSQPRWQAPGSRGSALENRCRNSSLKTSRTGAGGQGSQSCSSQREPSPSRRTTLQAHPGTAPPGGTRRVSGAYPWGPRRHPGSITPPGAQWSGTAPSRPYAHGGSSSTPCGACSARGACAWDEPFGSGGSDGAISLARPRPLRPGEPGTAFPV